MNWFLKTFISLISLVPSGMWKRPEVDQTHEKSPKTTDTRYRGGGNTQAHGSPLSGGGSCFWTGSLWESVKAAYELSTFVAPTI